MTGRVLIFSLLLSFFFSACKTDNTKIIGSLLLDEYTPTHNKTIGNAIDKKIIDSYEVISPEDKPEAMEYINALLRLLVNTPALTQRETYNWQISILPDTTQSNIFSLPNGHIYVYTGMLQHLESESQLLSLLAHEMAYVEKGFATLALENAFSKQELGDIILENGKADLTAMAAEFPFISHDNEKVTAADIFSVELLCPFVYEPRGIVKILENSTANDISLQWLNFKPCDNISERIETINRSAADCGLDGVKNYTEYQVFLTNIR